MHLRTVPVTGRAIPLVIGRRQATFWGMCLFPAVTEGQVLEGPLVCWNSLIQGEPGIVDVVEARELISNPSLHKRCIRSPEKARILLNVTFLVTYRTRKKNSTPLPASSWLEGPYTALGSSVQAPGAGGAVALQSMSAYLSLDYFLRFELKRHEPGCIRAALSAFHHGHFIGTEGLFRCWGVPRSMGSDGFETLHLWSQPVTWPSYSHSDSWLRSAAWPCPMIPGPCCLIALHLLLLWVILPNPLASTLITLFYSGPARLTTQKDPSCLQFRTET